MIISEHLYGGEEFMICLHNTDIAAARMIAESIRKSVMEKEFIIGKNKIDMTCSFGVQTVTENSKYMSLDSIIELVDSK